MKKLLLLHGALGCAQQFEAFAKEIKNFEPILYEFPGHGTRMFTNSKAHTALDYTQDLFQFIHQNKWKQISVWGHSMGGYCAALCEKFYPGTFEQIFTLGTKWEWNSEIAAKETSKLNLDLLKEKAPAFIHRMETYHGSAKLPELFEAMRGLMLDLGNNTPLHDLIGINIPIHIFRGDLDKMVAEEESLKFSNSNPYGSYTNLPDTKHAYEDVSIEKLLQTLE
jgi:esterase/lipase